MSCGISSTTAAIAQNSAHCTDGRPPYAITACLLDHGMCTSSSGFDSAGRSTQNDTIVADDSLCFISLSLQTK